MLDHGDLSSGCAPVGRLRLAVGLAAAAATVPYLTLKAAWVAGSTVGMADPAFFRTSTYLVANLVSFLLDAVAVVVALALTFRWGQRLPAWAVLVPMWVATGFLGTIAVLLPVAAPLASGTPAGGSGDDPLESWVYVLVYCGFAVQGLLLLAAFALYARQRWPDPFQVRCAEAGPGRNRRLQVSLTAAGVGLAVLVGVFNLLWGLGATMGLGGLSGQQTAVDRATLGVYGVLTLAAVTGVIMLVSRRPGRVRLWLPLALTWVGTGSMFAWGCYFLALAAADPTLSTPALSLATGAKVAAALLVARAVVLLLDRFRPASPSSTAVS